MRPEQYLEKLIRRLRFKASADLHERTISDAMQAQAKSKKTKSVAHQPNIWRKIMKTKIAKLATAATIILAVILSITILNKTTSTAWAIEQTIGALEHIEAVYLSGYTCYPGKPKHCFEIWARPHSDDSSVSGDFRLHEGDNHISIASEEKNITHVYTHYPQQEAVYITEGLNRGCNPFPGRALFTEFKKTAKDWEEEYSKDPETDRDIVTVRFEGSPVNTARYWLVQFDVETKFPIRASVWWDKDRKGEPHFDYTDMVYNPEIPEGFFDFEVSEEIQVIDCRQIHKLIDENQNLGTSVDDLTIIDSCKRVVKEYWQAIIKQDWPKVQKLRPLAVGSKWEELQAIYEKIAPVKLVEISGMNHLADPGAFAEVTCIIKTKEGKTAESVLNVEIRQTAQGKIAVVAGALGKELSIIH